ncbi:MAG TPA: hypothetical protein VG253_25035 [Streptosporangiaceae bacterium]|nr:hypothetical protein [Streptosporangiaceae bacterium]
MPGVADAAAPGTFDGDAVGVGVGDGLPTRDRLPVGVALGAGVSVGVPVGVADLVDRGARVGLADLVGCREGECVGDEVWLVPCWPPVAGVYGARREVAGIGRTM